MMMMIMMIHTQYKYVLGSDSVATTESFGHIYIHHNCIIWLLFICIFILFNNNEGCSILCSCAGEILFKPLDCVKGGIWGRNPNTWNLYSPIHTRVGLLNGGNTSIRELGNIFSFSGKYLRHISCVKPSQNRWEGVCRVI